MEVVILTIADYRQDFKRYLSRFWLDRFMSLLLEVVVLRYAQRLLFGGPDRSAGLRVGPDVEWSDEVFLVIVQDLTRLSKFVCEDTRKSVVQDALSFINDLLDMLQVPLTLLIPHPHAPQTTGTELIQLISDKATAFPKARKAGTLSPRDLPSLVYVPADHSGGGPGLLQADGRGRG
jgi:hypothetical protein